MGSLKAKKKAANAEAVAREKELRAVKVTLLSTLHDGQDWQCHI